MDDDGDMEDDENDWDNEGDEKDVLGGEGEPERDRASVSFEPSRFGCASAASRCLNQALEKVDGTRRRKRGEGM